MNQNKLKSPIQNAFQYILLISIIYVIYKFTNPSSPSGTGFINYILPLLFTDIIIIFFPLLIIFFYFKDGNTIDKFKDTMLNKDDPQVSEMNNRETIREYHTMLKEDIITQEEFDTIKKKYLKDIHNN